jgi:hypothetical protein
MNGKALVAAGIFIAIALIVPTFALITQANGDINELVAQGPNLADETQVERLQAELTQRHTTLFIIVLAVEIACVILIAISLWIALKP